MNKVRVGIYGAAGYTAGELLRLLGYHPGVAVTQAQSESQAGKMISEIHRDLMDWDLTFCKHLDFSKLDVLFMCKGHGESTKFMENNDLKSMKIIDLSHDFRARNNAGGFVYGLPEINSKAIQKSDRVANPGCFATAIQLALLPAAAHHLIDSDVHISGITGSTGAGQQLAATSHFSWRNGNMSVYKAFTHQHLAEIKESLVQVNRRFQETIHFIPYRGNFTRGILVTSYFHCDAELAVVKAYYREFYDQHPFIFIVDQNPDLKQVVNTNRAILYLEKHGDQMMVIAAIDNLLKGASGQAVQNMNLMFGFDESIGLQLKTIAF